MDLLKPNIKLNTKTQIFLITFDFCIRISCPPLSKSFTQQKIFWVLVFGFSRSNWQIQCSQFVCRYFLQGQQFVIDSVNVVLSKLLNTSWNLLKFDNGQNVWNVNLVFITITELLLFKPIDCPKSMRFQSGPPRQGLVLA